MIKNDAHKMMYYCYMKLKSVVFPCRHMFTVMEYANMKGIPSGCILHWWTIEAQEHIQINEDFFAHEENDDLCDKDSKIKAISRRHRKRA